MLLKKYILVAMLYFPIISFGSDPQIKTLQLTEESTVEDVKKRKWQIYKLFSRQINEVKNDIMSNRADLTVYYSYLLFEKHIRNKFVKEKLKTLKNVDDVNSLITQWDTFVYFDETYWVNQCKNSGSYTQGIKKTRGQSSGWYKC